MFIVEDGTGKYDANSYVSLEEAEDYFYARNATACNITEGHLVAATEFVDLIYGMCYLGNKMTDSQALLYPRTQFTDGHGSIVPEGTIPEPLKVAVYHAAKLYADGTELLTENPDSQLQSITQSVDGAVSQSKTWFAPVNRSKVKVIGRYIAPILDTSFANRTVRA